MHFKIITWLPWRKPARRNGGPWRKLQQLRQTLKLSPSPEFLSHQDLAKALERGLTDKNNTAVINNTEKQQLTMVFRVLIALQSWTILQLLISAMSPAFYNSLLSKLSFAESNSLIEGLRSIHADCELHRAEEHFQTQDGSETNQAIN